jgi:hypothetical protein
MITIFSIPKPFEGHIGIIQENAIRSWNNIGFEIILFGNEKGVAEIAKKYNAIHYPDISLNEYGTPYLDTIFSMANQIASSEILCYCNADILLFGGMIVAIKSLKSKIPEGFLVVGERWNYTTFESLDTRDSKVFLNIVLNHTLQPIPGLDYFLFPKGMIKKMPPFVVGRAGWDNWLIYDTRKRGIPVINATAAIAAVHQDHTYNHVPGQSSDTWKGSPESRANLNLVKNRYIYLWELSDSNYWMNRHGEMEEIKSYQTFFQNLILNTPELFHPVLEIICRLGHYIKYAYIRVSR